MQISKQRLIQIIKEELQSNSVAGEHGEYEEQPQEPGSPCALKANISDMLSGLEPEEALHIMNGVAKQLGLAPKRQEPHGEYGGERDYSGFVTTREGLEDLIASELLEVLKNETD